MFGAGTVRARLPMRLPRCSLRRVLLVGLCAAVVGAGVGAHRHFRWKRFAAVVPAQIYRSGLLTEHQLESAIEKLALKTVICLAPNVADRERAVCQRKGVQFRSFDMHSSGQGRPEDYAAVVGILSDPEAQPVLVHCEAGVARTGAAVALYRMSQEGWSFDEAIAELKSFEHRGRCSPRLQDLIQQVSRDELRR